MQERHGLSKTREYKIWKAMIGRCHNPNHSGYHLYGERGIKVCDAWRSSFVAFLNDVGNSPGPYYSLDRIDNDKNYEPLNVRWATPKEQANNKRTNRRVTGNGRTLTVGQWATELGISEATLRDRLDSGWNPEDAVSTPRLSLPRNTILVEINGKTKTLHQLAADTGIKYQTLWWRHTHNLPLIS